MHLALLKLSTANAFAKGLNASATTKRSELSSTSLPYDAAYGAQSSGGSASFSDDSHTPASPSSFHASAFTSTLGTADAPGGTQLLSPALPQRSPYYGMYADYEDVMELLHSGVAADGNARHLLSHVVPEQMVHVAHLGLGACCSVDLVAVHCGDGSRLLAAAKSCYLPPSDPRLRASLREAELLRKCAECPFIMQLLAVVMQEQLQEPPATIANGGAGSPGTISPVGTPPRNSMHLGGTSFTSCEQMAATGAMAAPPGSRLVSGTLGSGDAGLLGGAGLGGLASSPSSAAAAMAAMVSSPAYQAWAQWRGGGGGEDLERQVLQRLMAATGASTGGGGGGAGMGLENGAGVGFCGGLAGGVGSMLPGSLAASGRSSLSGWDPRSSLSGWDAGTQEELHDAAIFGCGGGGLAVAAHGYGGGWAYGSGGAYGSGCGAMAAPAAAACQDGSRRPYLRRASMDIVDMYGGCAGMGSGGGGGGGGATATTSASPSCGNLDGTAAGGGGGGEAPVMCTLLLGWARCGDLRRLVQLLLGRSPAHQSSKATGAPPPVCGLPPLVPEDVARFYTGCLVLALEHLHAKLHTVHRDLKLANLLLLDSGYAVVGDLGTAVDLSTVPGGRLNSRVGSPGHMAPECRDRDEAGYDTSADMWSVGACLFALLTGQLPAGLAGPPNRQWTPPVSRHWSAELATLMVRLLAWSPAQRPSVSQLMRDPWFRGFNWKALREQRMQPPSNAPWRELLWWPKESRQLL